MHHIEIKEKFDLAVFPSGSAITATVAGAAPLQVGFTVNLASVSSDQNDFTPEDNRDSWLTLILGNLTFFPVIGR